VIRSACSALIRPSLESFPGDPPASAATGSTTAERRPAKRTRPTSIDYPARGASTHSLPGPRRTRGAERA
jgi:hypothetical protein